MHPDKLKVSFDREAFQSLAAAKDALLKQLEAGTFLPTSVRTS